MIPEISIIIPVFRAERTLSLCIESLLNLNSATLL